MKDFSHGGEIYTLENRNSLLDFSININPLGPSEKGFDAMMKTFRRDMERYPDSNSRELISAVSRRYEVPEENIVSGNGATELIYRLVSHFSPRRIYVPAPGFSEYEHAAFINHIPVTYYPVWDAGTGVQKIEVPEKLEKHSIIFMGNPNNPDGRSADARIKKSVLEKLQESGSLLVMDESFSDFSENTISWRQEALAHKEMLVLLSFTKFYAMPGLRAGCLMGNEKWIGIMKDIMIPWSLNGPAQAYLSGALADKEYTRETRALVKKERHFLLTELQKVYGIKVFSSEANFLLGRFPDNHGSFYIKAFLKSGILIRRCNNFHGLDDSYFRIAVRTHPENIKLVSAFKEVFKS